MRSFIRNVGFYWRFIKDFSEVSHSLCELLENKSKFDFHNSCLRAFGWLKKKLVSAPIIIAPDWREPFEVLCDPSVIALGIVLVQRHEKILHPIYYASKALNAA